MKGYIIILVTLFSSILHAQNVDTIRLHESEYRLIRKQNGICFSIKGKKVLTKCYSEQELQLSTSDEKLVYLEVYYDKAFKELKQESLISSKGNLEGTFKSYHQNGQLELKGVFVDSVDVNNLNIKTGKWTVYDEKGKVVRTEKWLNGVYQSYPIRNEVPVHHFVLKVNDAPYFEGQKVSIKEFSNINIDLASINGRIRGGRYQCRFMIMGGKTPLVNLNVDLLVLEYFDVQKFLGKYNVKGGFLFFEFTDTKTGIYYNVNIPIIE